MTGLVLPDLREAIRTYSLTGKIGELEKQARENDTPYVGLLLLAALAPKNPDLQSALGDRYYQGIEVGMDDAHALELFEEAAARGSVESAYDLAWYYFDLKEYLRAAEYFEICVRVREQLSADRAGKSYGCLGACYANIPDPKLSQAFENLTIAAEKYHNSFACRRLGYLYIDEKQGSHFDAVKGVHYLQLAAEYGDEIAACEMGRCYLFGEEDLKVEKNVKKAEEILLLHKNSDNADILKYLGMLYLYGDDKTGIAEDLNKALAYFDESSRIFPNGITTASMGYVYYKLGQYAEAEKKLLEAEELGNSTYSDFLGRMYREGNLGAPNRSQALKFYRQAYKKNSINNVFTCGEYAELLEEMGDYQSAYEAAEYGEKRFNDIYFIFLKSKLVLQGKITNRQSLSEAVNRMQECMEYHTRDKEVNEVLGNYYFAMREYRKAERYLLESFRLGAANAGVVLGRLYEAGGGTISASAEKAYEWYSKAAAAGSEIGREEAGCFKKGLLGGYKRVRRLS